MVRFVGIMRETSTVENSEKIAVDKSASGARERGSA
jgi:hypothetical protein